MKQFINVMLFAIISFLAIASTSLAENSIICASTTSTQNSGLYEYILPLFEKQTGIKVKVIAVGTGAALEIGKRGDADVVLVHSKEDELHMIKEGWFVSRHDLMYNDFIIVGPPLDPAGISGMHSARKAFGVIAGKGSGFVSRGDNSGTHKKERQLWRSMDIRPSGHTWYLEVGQGMAKTLRIAGEKRSYTLTDRGTYLSMSDKESIALEIMVQGDSELFNQYSVMLVNPEVHAHVKRRESMKFIEWLTSEEGQGAIASFRDKKGNRLFTPNAK